MYLTPRSLRYPVGFAGLSDLNITTIPGATDFSTVTGYDYTYLNPSTSDFNWNQFAGTLAQSGTTLAQQALLQPGMQITPYGMSQQSAGYPIGTGLSTAVGGISTSTLMVLGIAAIAVFAMMSAGKR